MKSKRMTAFLVSASMAFSWSGSPVLAEKKQAAEQENSVIGTLAFAQCDDYINIRSSADSESDVTGKIYNDCAATIIDKDGDWYEITSGNAVGYVSSEYFATGEEAQQIADKVAYNVATVHPEVLMVRTQADESSDVLDVAQQSEELEVVQWEGDWMKVALDQDTYGYVNAYYVDYNTYYPVAETLEEERQRLADEQTARGAVQQAENQAQDSSGQTENQSSQTVSKPEQNQDAAGENYIETEPEYIEAEPEYVETEP
ncbi:MAG: SH3 domain-containing protein, partial [Eubacteriales bacterium]|nr:SH3 domain-containing protein [Eubacteriales bacterium]